MNIALITTGLKAFAVFWSLLFFVLSAAMIGRFNAGYYNGSGFSEGNACLAASIFDLLYFCAVVAMLFLRPTNIFISVLVDTVIIGFLFILNLGSVAALTQGAGYFRSRSCRLGFETAFCGIATGVLVVGWIMVFLLLGLLIFEVFITLRSYGGDIDTWKTPFNELVTNGAPRRGAGAGMGIGHKSETANAGVGGPQVVQNRPQVVQNV